jgi:hypothetical protein
MDTYDKKRHLYVDKPDERPDPLYLATIIKANPNTAQMVINAAVNNNGRSPWLWVRLANGDLLLATFPCGDTYIATEKDRKRP